jgi:hypothetical protein
MGSAVRIPTHTRGWYGRDVARMARCPANTISTADELNAYCLTAGRAQAYALPGAHSGTSIPTDTEWGQ